MDWYRCPLRSDCVAAGDPDAIAYADLGYRDRIFANRRGSMVVGQSDFQPTGVSKFVDC